MNQPQHFQQQSTSRVRDPLEFRPHAVIIRNESLYSIRSVLDQIMPDIATITCDYLHPLLMRDETMCPLVANSRYSTTGHAHEVYQFRELLLGDGLAESLSNRIVILHATPDVDFQMIELQRTRGSRDGVDLIITLPRLGQPDQLWNCVDNIGFPLGCESLTEQCFRPASATPREWDEFGREIVQLSERVSVSVVPSDSPPHTQERELRSSTSVCDQGECLPLGVGFFLPTRDEMHQSLSVLNVEERAAIKSAGLFTVGDKVSLLEELSRRDLDSLSNQLLRPVRATMTQYARLPVVEQPCRSSATRDNKGDRSTSLLSNPLSLETSDGHTARARLTVGPFQSAVGPVSLAFHSVLQDVGGVAFMRDEHSSLDRQLFEIILEHPQTQNGERLWAVVELLEDIVNPPVPTSERTRIEDQMKRCLDAIPRLPNLSDHQNKHLMLSSPRLLVRAQRVPASNP